MDVRRRALDDRLVWQLLMRRCLYGGIMTGGGQLTEPKLSPRNTQCSTVGDLLRWLILNDASVAT